MSENPDPLGKVTEGAGLIGKIRNFLAGFVGYVERNQRREADKLLRQTLAERYEEQWGRVSDLQRQMISQGQIQYVDDLERAAIKLRQVIDRVERASYGYSALFDHVTINEDELAKIYAYDAALLENVENLARAIDNVETSVGSDGLPAALSHLEKLSQDVVDVYNRRDEVILA